MADPDAAAVERERYIKELGFVGMLIPNYAAGVYRNLVLFTPPQ
jgi:predicted TIM-barrel fold metal-dependent hydrolase